MSLPGADELFRTTGGTALQSSTPQSDRQRANGESPGGTPRVPAPSREGDSEAVAAGAEAEPEADADEAGAEESDGPGGDTGAGARGARTGPGGKTGPAAPAAGTRTTGGPARRDPEATEHGGREAGADAGPGGRARQEEREPPAQPRTKSARQGGGSAAASAQPRRGRGRGAARRPSGRERHDEKITVYVSAEELMDLEHARLVLRGDHGLAVDRGRIVREAVAVVLADLESRGDASILVRRLRGR
ncbi:hypothetical protein [Streptomyces sp. MAR4 CNX-425]|uniref:hypothetical protein n=1 Tax=Streptomyces sp. MAR4 CNX-425 TaxID=3406343 RepID=UPI003B505B22